MDQQHLPVPLLSNISGPTHTVWSPHCLLYLSRGLSLWLSGHTAGGNHAIYIASVTPYKMVEKSGKFVIYMNVHGEMFNDFVGFGAMALSLIYPHRMVQKLILLRGGELLKIVTYGHLKHSKERLVEMQNISSLFSRQKANPYLRVRVEGTRFWFLVNARIGTFPEPDLFDRVIGDIKAK